MTLTVKENAALLKIIRCNAPEVWERSITEVVKIRTCADLSEVSKLKAVYDILELSDKRLFLAICLKKVHPALYDSDNALLPVKYGLCRAIAEATGMKESNCSNLMKEVRVWLIHNFDDLRTKTDEVYTKIITMLPESKVCSQ